MNAHVAIVKDETAVAFVAQPETAIAVLKDTKQADAFFVQIEAEIDALVPDVSTTKGRDAIKSLAFKVTKTKTYIDATRKVITEDARKQVDAVNAAGRVIWDRLEDLAATARKPLTDWEQAEKDRVQQVADWFAAAERAVVIRNDDTSDAIVERLTYYEGVALDPAVFGDSLERAEATRQQTVEVLRAAHSRLVQDEADRAELARLREDAAAREEQERLAKEAEDAKAKAEADAKLAQERETEIARQAAEDAKAEAARVAQKALDDQAAAHQAELARLQKVADDKAAAEKVEADLAAQREKNRAHVTKVMGAAKLAIMGLGVSEDQAREIVKAIKAGSIPNVTITF